LGSGITGYKYNFGSDSYYNEYLNVTSPYLPNSTYSSGTRTCYVWAIDSRNRHSAPASVSVTFAPYSAPTITSVMLERCNASGAADALGTYAKIKIVYGYDSVGGKNSASATYAVNKNGAWSAENAVGNNTELVFGGDLNPVTAYNVRFTVTDATGAQASAAKLLTALKTALRFEVGGGRLHVNCPVTFNETVTAGTGAIDASAVYVDGNKSYPAYTVGIALVNLKNRVEALEGKIS
jgi:hypothetical protein